MAHLQRPDPADALSTRVFHMWDLKNGSQDLCKFRRNLGLTEKDYARRYSVRDNIGLLHVRYPGHHVAPAPAPPRSSSALAQQYRNAPGHEIHGQQSFHGGSKTIKTPVAYPSTPASRHASLFSKDLMPVIQGSKFAHGQIGPRHDPESSMDDQESVPGDLETYPEKLKACLEQSARVLPLATSRQGYYLVTCDTDSTYMENDSETVGMYQSLHKANLKVAEHFFDSGTFASADQAGEEHSFELSSDGRLTISTTTDGSMGGFVEIYVSRVEVSD